MRCTWGEMAYGDSRRTATALLFLHGTGCDSRDWDGVTSALGPGVRAIAADFRGHGSSAVPRAAFTLEDLAADVILLADHLGLGELVIVGHSLGGMVAIEVARRWPRLSGLVLLEGWTALSAAGAFEGERFYGALPHARVEEIKGKDVRTRGRFAPQVWSAFWRSVEQFDAYAYLEGATIPILEVYGGMGRTRRTRRALRVPENPNIEWVWIAGAGHYLPHERPDEVARACLRGLERVRSARGH